LNLFLEAKLAYKVDTQKIEYETMKGTHSNIQDQHHQINQNGFIRVFLTHLV